MMEEYYRLLGLDESATDEEVTARYEALVEKNKEDRWLEGEAGNQAAKMLNKLEVAYKEIMMSRGEKRKTGETGENKHEEVAKALRANDLTKAQDLLDGFNERDGEWHYLQAVIFYKKNWYNESKKQLEIAMRIDPDNKKYKEAYTQLNEKYDYENLKADKDKAQQHPQGRGGYGDPYENPQMGGNVGICPICCCSYCCMDCLSGCCTPPRY